MDSQAQNFDQWLNNEWLEEPSQSQIVNTTSDIWQNYTCLNDFDTLQPKDFSNVDELDFIDSRLAPSFLPIFQPSPPVLETSPSAESLFEEDQQFGSWDFLASPSNDTINSAALCDIAFAKEFPVMSDYSSPSSGSELNSPLTKSPSSTLNKLVKPSTRNRAKGTSKTPRSTSSASRGRNTHNLIEKKYRTNLNNKIMCLRDRIPILSSSSENEDEESGSADNRRPLKCNKGVILEKAIDYISELETQKEAQALEILKLRSIMNNWRKINLQPSNLFCDEFMRGF